MEEHHYLGFRRLAGRGLRYVAIFGGLWLGLAAWQNGAFKCRPRDRWCGWRQEQQFRRLDIIANNTRFLILSEPGVFPNLVSFFLARMTRRLADDWPAAHGRQVLLAETFCDPEVFAGTMYRATGWEGLGRTKGVARANGRHTDPHGRLKENFVTALRPDARALLSSPLPLPPGAAPLAGPGLPPGAGKEALRGLRAQRARARRARQHEGMPRRRAVREGAVAEGACDHRRLENPQDGAARTGLQVHNPPGRTFGGPRGARRRGRSLERGPAYPCPGARRRRQAHPRCQPQRLDCVFSVKGNAPETFGILDSIDLERDADGRSTEDPYKAHGRLEQRSISVLTPLKRLINFPGVSKIARVTRYREPLKKDSGQAGKDHTETAYLMTSLDAAAASPVDLLRLNRGHWAAENLNHRQRDCVCGQDACLTRTGNGPANRASLNNIALAVVFTSRRGAESLAETRRRLQLNRSEAIAALTRP